LFGSSFTFIYAISVNNGAIDRIPTTNIPAVNENTFANEDFWWLIGYLQGDGSVDLRNGIWFHSTDRELIDAAKSLVSSLFRLSSSIYLEKPKPHRKPRLRLAVYSRTLVRWLFKQQLNFGTQRWTVPKLSNNLFCPYLAGLFDAEGQVVLAPSGRLSKLVLHSANGSSLRIIEHRLGEFGVECLLRTRNRERKPSVHYQLEIRKSQNLKCFIGPIARHSRLTRKKQYLTEDLISKKVVEACRYNSPRFSMRPPTKANLSN